jgi:hypothetical protein
MILYRDAKAWTHRVEGQGQCDLGQLRELGGHRVRAVDFRQPMWGGWSIVFVATHGWDWATAN